MCLLRLAVAAAATLILGACRDGPTRVAPGDLTVSLDLSPNRPSATQDTLGIVAVLGIGNPHPYPVVLRARDHYQAWTRSVRVCSTGGNCSVVQQPVFRDQLVLAPFESHYEVLRIVQPGRPLVASPGRYSVTGTLLGRQATTVELNVVP